MGEKLTLAVTHGARLTGLLRKPEELSPLLIAPCCDVHTFGMRVPLDIAFLDVDGAVVHVVRGAPRCRRFRCPGAAMVIERVARAGPWLREGDEVGLKMMGSMLPACER